MPGGFIGVDVFFVISGFLISTILFSSLERERFSIVEFYVRRVQRIFPALILVLIATLAFGWFVLLAEEYKQLGKHTAAGVGFVQNFILFSESGYFDNAAGTKPLLHLWSIAVEEQFYIFWPLLLAFVWNREWSFLKITAGIGVISFIANIYLTQNIPAAAFYLPISRFWELMIGGILAYTILHRPELIDRHKNWQALLGFALIATALFLLDKGRDFPGFWALLPTIGTALIISAGQNAWLNQKLLANRLMVGIGLISYPLYLWHWPLLSFAQILESSSPSREIRVAAVVLAFFLGWITYRFVEMPIRFGRNKSLKVSLLIVGMIFVGLLGYKIHSMDGVPSRESLKSITEISEGSSENLNPILCTQFGLQDNQTEKGLNCSYSSTGAQRTVAVFGDSHAAAAFVGIAEHLKASSINTLLLSGAGCPYLLGASVGDTEQIKAQCADNTGSNNVQHVHPHRHEEQHDNNDDHMHHVDRC
jgi:peptidoglycan/LPS O-acetylase OafA/YrhL